MSFRHVPSDEAESYLTRTSSVHLSPNFREAMYIENGITIRARFTAPIIVLPQPYPTLSYRGNVERGMIAPPTDDATVCAANAEAA